MLFLGTSSGTPTKERNVAALALIEDAGRAWYLVDCGEATQHQLLHTRLSLADLAAVFITHVHGDHCYGLPGLIASAGMLARKEPLRIVAPAGIEEWIRSTQTLTQLTLPYELWFEATESEESRRINNWLVQATPLSHRVPSFAYRFTEAMVEPQLDIEKLETEAVPRGPVWGRLRDGVDVRHEGRTLRSSDYLRFTRAARRLVVAGDNDQPELLRHACRQAQVLVHEATYTEEVAQRVGPRGHSTAAAVASFAQSAGLPNLVLTHFSPRYQSTPDHAHSIAEVRAEAERSFHGQLFLASDFSRFRLGKDGQLRQIA